MPSIIELTFKNKNKRGANRRVTRNKTPLINGSDRTITVRGKYLINLSLGTSAAAIALNLKTMGARLTTYGTLYQEFRFKRIQVKMHPAETASAIRSDYGLAYIKTLNTAAPSSISDLYQLPVSRVSTQAETVPVSLMVNENTLRQGTRVWYNTQGPAGTEVDDQNQGAFYFIGSLAASNAFIEIGYEVQLRGQTTPTIL